MKRNLSTQIRMLAERGQYGHRRTPRNFYMTEGGCSYYWHNGGIINSQRDWDRACRLLARYHSFCASVEGWTNTGSTRYYADNSVMAEQRSRQGAVRWVYAVAPNGDCC